LPRPEAAPTDTQRAAALAQALLSRYGIVTREAVQAEGIAGGFASVYPVLKALEDSGRARRGYFVQGLGGAQFALPGAEERLRSLRDPSEEPRTLVLAATDPANPYGALLPWPAPAGTSPEGEGGDARASADAARSGRPQRAAGALVILHDGQLGAWLGRGETSLTTFLPAEEPQRSTLGRAVAQALARLVDSRRRKTLLLAQIDGDDPGRSPLAPHLKAAGFTPGSRGWLKRRPLGEAEPEEPDAPTEPELDA
jgi:ATP-dependent Lhr-like helicase